jgi:hypothetical protein
MDLVYRTTDGLGHADEVVSQLLGAIDPMVDLLPGDDQGVTWPKRVDR